MCFYAFMCINWCVHAHTCLKGYVYEEERFKKKKIFLRNDRALGVPESPKVTLANEQPVADVLVSFQCQLIIIKREPQLKNYLR